MIARSYTRIRHFKDAIAAIDTLSDTLADRRKRKPVDEASSEAVGSDIVALLEAAESKKAA